MEGEWFFHQVGEFKNCPWLPQATVVLVEAIHWHWLGYWIASATSSCSSLGSLLTFAREI